MNEMVQKLISEVKLDEATAKKVVDVVTKLVKDKLPGPIADQVVNVLEGVDAKDIADKASGLLGGFMK